MASLQKHGKAVLFTTPRGEKVCSIYHKDSCTVYSLHFFAKILGSKLGVQLNYL